MELIKELDAREVGTKGKRERFGLFLCPFCYKMVEKIKGNGLRDKSCGCDQYSIGHNHSHGLHGHPLYRIYYSIKNRCYNKAEHSYKYYGDLGVCICDEWLENFKSFYDWCIKNKWESGMHISRKGDIGNYSPSNCKIITQLKNQRERRDHKLNMEKAREIRVLYKTGDYTHESLSTLYGVARSNITNIINGKAWREE